MLNAQLVAALTALAAGRPVPGGDLEIRYTDLHPLWGGVVITVDEAGAWRHEERGRGETAPRVTTGTVSPQGLRELSALLLEIEAWEQRVPEALPVPDESRATLTLSAAGETSAIWERFNDLAAGRRLGRVRAWLMHVCE